VVSRKQALRRQLKAPGMVTRSSNPGLGENHGAGVRWKQDLDSRNEDHSPAREE
jgi:hypothetical protein